MTGAVRQSARPADLAGAGRGGGWTVDWGGGGGQVRGQLGQHEVTEL